MKFLKNTIAVILLFTTLPLCAARSGAAAKTSKVTPQKQTAPAPQPTAQLITHPISNVATYKDLLGEIKNKMHSTDVWDSTNKRLKDLFVAAIKTYAKDANLTPIELEALLQAGQSFHATFTGYKANDSQTLTNVNNQIINAKNDFIKSMPKKLEVTTPTITTPAVAIPTKPIETQTTITESAVAAPVTITPAITKPAKPLPPTPQRVTKPIAPTEKAPEVIAQVAPQPVTTTPAVTIPAKSVVVQPIVENIKPDYSRARPDASTLLSSKQPCLASEAFGEGRLEGSPRALENTTVTPAIARPVITTSAATKPLPPTPERITKPITAAKPLPSIPEQPIAPFMPHLITLEDLPALNGSDELPEARYTPAVVQGIFQLQEFRKSSPETFGATLYVNGELNKEWLKQALKIVLNKTPLSEKNRVSIQEELSNNATELIKELFKNDIKTTSEQLQKIVNNVHNQVVRFINGQPSMQQLKPETQENRRPIIQQVALQPQELGQAKLPAAASTKPAAPVPLTKKILPNWLIQKNNNEYAINNKELADALYQAMADEKSVLFSAINKEGVDIDKVILEYFVQQVPDTIPNKTTIIEQIQFELELLKIEGNY